MWFYLYTYFPHCGSIWIHFCFQSTLLSFIPILIKTFFVQLWFLTEYFLPLFPSNNDLQSLRKAGILCVNQHVIVLNAIKQFRTLWVSGSKHDKMIALFWMMWKTKTKQTKKESKQYLRLLRLLLTVIIVICLCTTLFLCRTSLLTPIVHGSYCAKIPLAS